MTDKKDFKAIKEELPAPEDITIVCQYCDAKFTDKISLTNHMEIVHEDVQDITMVCHYCDAKYTNKTSLINHMKIAHDDRQNITIGCHYCDYGIISQIKYYLTDKIHHIKHMKIIHNAEESDLETSEKRNNSKNPNIIKYEDKSEEVTDKKDLETIKELHAPEDIREDAMVMGHVCGQT